MSTQRSLTRVAGLLAVASLAFAACSSSGSSAAPSGGASAAAGAGGASQELIAAAKKEGQLTVIALPHDWCGYGAVIDGFKAKYGLTVNELNPDAGSGDEIEAIKANKDNTGPQAPDVIDVGLVVRPARPRPTACSSPTRSRPGTRSRTAPRTPTATGTATTTACWPSR